MKHSTEQLKNERAQHYARASAALDSPDAQDRALTPDENRTYDEAVQYIDRLNKKIELLKKEEQMQMDKLKTQAAARGIPSGDMLHDDLFSANPQAARIQAAPSRTPRGFQSEEQANRAGPFLSASLYGDQRAANWCREHGVYHIATDGVNTGGGFLVPTELSSAIIALMNEYGVARRETRVIQMNSDTLTVPVRESGLTTAFYGEGAEISESGWFGPRRVWFVRSWRLSPEYQRK